MIGEVYFKKINLYKGLWLSFAAVIAIVMVSATFPAAQAQPTMLHPNLAVRTLADNLTTPISIAFLGQSDILVLEKNTGKVKRIASAMESTVLDLAVNFGSERGLLGIALHPDFPANPGVYLYWTESTTGADTSNLAEVPLLGNRVDRFVWDGSSLMFDKNIIKLRAFQADAGQSLRGNHDGGVIRFGPDRKLYIIIGDVGRRGLLQNNQMGPVPDDQFGGPEPDNAHLTGVILRLNDDGTAPTDNPFFDIGAGMGGEVGANIQKIFAYGVRNSFGMAFDPLSGDLWTQENGDDSFDEINRVEPGTNLGWVQIMGPVDRIAQYKFIEVTRPPGNLQQLRWPPTLIANTSEEAISRLFVLPGSHYSDPEFSWKFAVAPAGIGFLNSQALGSQFRGDLFVGAATPRLEGGYLFHFNLAGNRREIGIDDPRLEDRVADNIDKFDITESESLLIGKDFGIGTDIQTGLNGNLFVVSLSNGAIYEIHRKKGSISGTKFNDLDGNGIRESNEAGLANWTIALTNDTGVTITQITAPNGSYNFTNLTDDNYTVGEVLQPGWIQTAPAVSGTGSATYKVNITGGNQVVGKDFGNILAKPGQVVGGGLLGPRNNPEKRFNIWVYHAMIPSGTVQVRDYKNGLTIKNTRIDSVMTAITATPKIGTITGDAEVIGGPSPGVYPFQVDIVDAADPGAGADSFKITLSGYPGGYTNSGTLSMGDITVVK